MFRERRGFPWRPSVLASARAYPRPWLRPSKGYRKPPVPPVPKRGVIVVIHIAHYLIVSTTHAVFFLAHRGVRPSMQVILLRSIGPQKPSPVRRTS